MIPVTPWRVSTYSHANNNCVEVTGWRASSASTFSGQCAEAGTCACGVAIRDSKDRGGAVLLVPPAAWTAFTGVLK